MILNAFAFFQIFDFCVKHFKNISKSEYMGNV